MDKLQNDGETDTKKNQEITEFRRIETSKSENIKSARYKMWKYIEITVTEMDKVVEKCSLIQQISSRYRKVCKITKVKRVISQHFYKSTLLTFFYLNVNNRLFTMLIKIVFQTVLYISCYECYES